MAEGNKGAIMQIVNAKVGQTFKYAGIEKNC